MKKHQKRRKKTLRSGSKAIKKMLLATNPHCDICGSGKSLQLHHVYLVRHGFTTQLDRCVLLCASCHCDFHIRWDKYLDITYQENPEADFMSIYNVIKKL